MGSRGQRWALSDSSPRSIPRFTFRPTIPHQPSAWRTAPSRKSHITTPPCLGGTSMFRDTDFFWTMRWSRFDAIAIFVVAVGTMAVTEGRWSWFLAWFLVPDLSMTGYLFGRRAGAVVYNTAHMYAWPLAMCTVGFARG